MFHALIGAAVFLFLCRIVPPLGDAMNPLPIPHIPTDRMLSSRPLAEGGSPGVSTSKHIPAETIVFGPFWSTRFRGTNRTGDERPTIPFTHDLAADAGELVEIPGVGSVEYDGAIIRPVRTPFFDRTETIPTDQLVMHPSGRWMTAEEVRQLHRTFPIQGKNMRGEITPATSRNGSAFEIIHQFTLRSPLGSSMEIHQLNALDALTGLNEDNGGWTSTHRTDVEGEIVRTTKRYSFSQPGLRHGPSEMHLTLRHGEEAALDFPMAAPHTLSAFGHKITLTGITASSPTSTTQTLLHGSIPPFTYLGGGGGNWRTEFYLTPLPVELIRVEALIREDAPDPSSWGQSSSAQGVSYSFNCPPEDFIALRVRLVKERSRVVFRLPPLPHVSPENRDQRDAMKLTVPPMIIQTEWDMKRLLEGALQADITVSVARGGAPPPILYPLDTTGKTIGDLFRLHAGVPPGIGHEVAWTLGGHHRAKLEVLPRGATRKRLHPIRGAFVEHLTGPRSGLLIGLLILGGIKALFMMRAYRYLSVLRGLGYTDWKLWESEYLLAHLGGAERQLPPRDELGTVPGVNPDDPAAVVEVLKRDRRW